MNISIKHLEHFVVVAQELHFRRAAEVANVAQPALSRSIKTLENELGVQLLDRNSRKVKLTAAGVEFLAGCNEIIAGMNRTVEKSLRALQNETGIIKLGYTYIAMCSTLPTLLSEFSKRYPDIVVEEFCFPTLEQNTRLLHDELDVCFVTRPAESQDINSLLFHNHDFAAIINKNHRMAKGDSISLEALSKETIILRACHQASAFNSHVKELFEAENLHPNIEYMHQDDSYGVLGGCVLNKGICIEAAGTGGIFENHLKTLKITGSSHTLPTVMEWRKHNISESLQTFRRFALHHISSATNKKIEDSSFQPIPEPN